MKDKKKRRGGKKLACYSQALELDVKLLHLHFIPRLQLKRKKKKVNNHGKYSNCMVKEQKWLVIVIQHVVELVKWRRRSLHTSFTLTCQSTLNLTLLDILTLREAIVSFISPVCCAWFDIKAKCE